MMKKADLFHAMANDKRRQAEAAWNPHIVRQCLELAQSYERRALQEEQRTVTQYADDVDYGDMVPQWPRRPTPARRAHASRPAPAWPRRSNDIQPVS